jgi:hypothetical protein
MVSGFISFGIFVPGKKLIRLIHNERMVTAGILI